MEGTDDIGLSLKKIKNIQDYEDKLNISKPWLNNND